MALTRVVGVSTLLTENYQVIETMGGKANIVGILLNNTDMENDVRPHVHLVPSAGAVADANAIYNEEVPAGGNDSFAGPLFAGQGATINAKGAGISITVSRVEGI